MNKLIVKVLPLLLLFEQACNPTPAIQQEKSEIYRDFTRDTALQQKKEYLSTEMEGVWISEIFLQKIAKSKSVYSGKNYPTQLLGLQINSQALLSNEPFISGFKESDKGWRNYLLFDRNKACFMNDMNKHNPYPSIPKPFDLTLESERTIELVYPIDKLKERYRKIESSLDNELRRLVVAGTYIAEGDSVPITFTEDGQVNFLDFKSYRLVYDFAEGIEFDAILFFKSQEPSHHYKSSMYKFEVQGKQLLLNPVTADWATQLHDILPERIQLNKMQ